MSADEGVQDENIDPHEAETNQLLPLPGRRVKPRFYASRRFKWKIAFKLSCVFFYSLEQARYYNG